MSEQSIRIPLTPPDCDLRDFPFMPLDVVRLRDSDITALSDGDEFRCAVLLWCASWHQVPAASIPDDDVILAQLAGFGRVVKEWKKVREGSLRGWIKCSDGRLYHPVVAEKAVEAWSGRIKYRERKEIERVRLAEKRAAAKRTDEENIAGSPSNITNLSDVQAADVAATDHQVEATTCEKQSNKDECCSKNGLIVERDSGQWTVDRDSKPKHTPLELEPSRARVPEPPPDSAPSSDPPSTRAVQVAIVLRQLGVSPITGQSPHAHEIAETGATDDQLRGAVEQCRQLLGRDVVPTNYLRKMLPDYLAAPTRLPNARASPGYESARDRSRRETTEVLTGRKNGQPTVIDVTPSASSGRLG